MGKTQDRAGHRRGTKLEGLEVTQKEAECQQPALPGRPPETQLGLGVGLREELATYQVLWLVIPSSASALEFCVPQVSLLIFKGKSTPKKFPKLHV